MNKPAQPHRTFELDVIHPDPGRAHEMPYAPAVRIVGACDLMFISGATPSPLYHKHPYIEAEHIHPHDIRDQTRLAMENIKLVLDECGANWRYGVNVTKYLTAIS